MAATEIEIVAETMSPAIEISIALTTTLLLRLDEAAPRLALDIPATRTTALPRLGRGDLVRELAEEHGGFASVDRLRRGRASDPALRLVFDGGAAGLRISSSGWACCLGAHLDGAPGNAIAAAFAGVLGAAEAFKAALGVAGVRARRIRPWDGTVSLWDYSLSPNTGSELPDSIDLEGFGFVGCGGVASASAWTLALLALRGSPFAIDADTIDDTNLNRHLTASFRQVGEQKAILLAALLSAAGASAKPLVARWDEFPPDRQRAVEIGLISVDDDAVRRDFQLAMPRLILNAGTADTGFYQVTSHDFLHEACLGCVARGDLVASGQEGAAAQRLGLSVADLRRYVADDRPLPDHVLARLPADDAHALHGVTGGRLLQVVCGHLRAAPGEPAVSAPMLSAAPGVLLAGEAVKRAIAADVPLQPEANAVNTSILTGPHERWLMRRSKRPDCTCRDPDYRAYYEKRWTASPA